MNQTKQKPQLYHIYLSPKIKHNRNLKKIYSTAGLFPRTYPNQQTISHLNITNSLNFINKIPNLKSTYPSNSLIFSQRKRNNKDFIFNRDVSLKQHAFNQKQLLFKSLTRYSNNSRQISLTSRISKPQKTQKSTMFTELQKATNRLQRFKQDKKNHQLGKNCRVVVIKGTTEEQHFVTVDKIDDVMVYLRKQCPRFIYYKTIPTQLTIDYFLIEGGIDGRFLNGQSLYLKPCTGIKNKSIDQREQIDLNSFQIIKLIGSGGFSKVFLCRFKQDGRFYAIKVIQKQFIIKNKKKRIIMNQRNIMKSANHPFMIEMKFAFQQEKYLCFVTEYCSGGQLFGLIKKHRRLQEDIARFYIIEIFLGLSYLHGQKVVYRDIKPENILLKQNGHVKIADLGLAKPDMSEKYLAYSFCGSPEYMSPEMILQAGHTFPVDYYCMGALLYELLTGLPPYYSRDPNQIYKAVLSQPLNFPSDIPLTPQCKSLLKGLLCKQPKHRLGSIHGVKQILAHPWFGKNQYSKFLEMEIEPPTNFLSIGKIDLDDYTNEQQNEKQLQQLKSEQKRQKKIFKQVMKDFYFDYRERSICQIDAKQKLKIQQEKTTSDLYFRKGSFQRKGQISSRQSNKQNLIFKKNFMNFSAKQKNMFQSNQKTTIKRITTCRSRGNLFKQKVVRQTPKTKVALNKDSRSQNF